MPSMPGRRRALPLHLPFAVLLLATLLAPATHITAQPLLSGLANQPANPAPPKPAGGGNAWPLGLDDLVLDVWVAPSRAPGAPFLAADGTYTGAAAPPPLWREERVSYDWAAGNDRSQNVTIPPALMEHLYSNGTLFAHVYVTRRGGHPDPSHAKHDPHWTLAAAPHPLVVFFPPAKVVKKRRLLGGGDAGEGSDGSEGSEGSEGSDGRDAAGGALEATDSLAPGATGAKEASGATAVVAAGTAGAPLLISHWKPSLDVTMVVDHTVFPNGGAGLPPNLKDHLHFREDKGGNYDPVRATRVTCVKYA